MTDCEHPAMELKPLIEEMQGFHGEPCHFRIGTDTLYRWALAQLIHCIREPSRLPPIGSARLAKQVVSVDNAA